MRRRGHNDKQAGPEGVESRPELQKKRTEAEPRPKVKKKGARKKKCDTSCVTGHVLTCPFPYVMKAIHHVQAFLM
jgi:hypothetical protein